MNYFTRNPNVIKKKKTFIFFWGGGAGEGSRVSEFFFTKNLNIIKYFFC